MKDNTTYQNAIVTKLPGSEVEISLHISAETLESYKQQTLTALAHTIDIDGFRKGKAPLAMVEKEVGSSTLLKESAERAIQKAYPDVLATEKIDAIGYPEVTITKLAWGNPLEVTIKTAIVPTLTLPEYKKIAERHRAQKTNKLYDVTDKEVDDVLLEIRKNKAHSDWHKANPDHTDHHDHPDFDKEENLPIVNEAFVSALGPFKTIDELRSHIKQNIMQEKEMKDAEKRRIALFDELIDTTKTDVPRILIESELAKMLGGLKDDVARSGLSFDEYLKEIKKTEEDIRTEWRAGAERRAKMQLILNEIAKAENINADKTILENEVKKLTELYKDADPERARIYVETMLINDEVVKRLEGKTEETK